MLQIQTSLRLKLDHVLGLPVCKNTAEVLLRKNTNLPRRVQDPAILIKSYEFIRSGDCMQVRLLAIVEKCIRFPNPFKHRYAECEGKTFRTTFECEAAINPALAEVAIHRVSLRKKFRPRQNNAQLCCLA